MPDNAAQTLSEPANKFTPTVTMVTLLGVTVVYVVGLGLLSTHLAPCEGATTDAAWTTRYLSCRTINEFGDALAGAFAPLAFLWLAGAVFIQSRELAAQRKELGLARDEARQTREVLAQQAAESRAATAFIGEQTIILKAQQAQKEQEEADEEFDQMLNVFCEIHSIFGIDIKFQNSKGGNSIEHIMIINYVTYTDSDDFLNVMLGRLRLFNKLNFHYGNIEITEWTNSIEFEKIMIDMHHILSFVEKLTPAHQQRSKALRLEDIYTELKRINAEFAPYKATPPS